MNALSMLLRILALLAAVAAAGLFYIGTGKLAEQEAATKTAQEAYETVQTNLQNTNEEMVKLEKKLSDERKALAAEKSKLETTRSEMYTARQELSRMQQQLTQSKENIEKLKSDTSELRKKLLAAEQQLVGSDDAARAAELAKLVESLEAKNAELAESLEAAKAEVAVATAKNTATGMGATSGNSSLGRWQSATPGQTFTYSSQLNPDTDASLPVASIGPTANIVSSSPRDGLIVLANDGSLGLAPGVQVKLVRELQALGSIQIVEVRSDLILANILPGAKTNAMSAGSQVQLMR